jgi:hypothetical protein
MERSSADRDYLISLFALSSAAISIVALILLHFLSPEFEPSWRMVSEYANGKFEWLLSIFFIAWGASTWLIVMLLWNKVNGLWGKAGICLLFISGLGEIMAAFFNVNHPLHGTAGFLGVPLFILASLFISYNIKNLKEWQEQKSWLIMTAHLSWISVLLVVITMVLMINGFRQAGIHIGPGQKPPASLPDGVIGIVGYANRLLILVYILWLTIVAIRYKKSG